MIVGASRTYTMDLPIASYIFTGGTHQLYAQVDTDNSVDECPHEDNNVFGPILSRPLASVRMVQIMHLWNIEKQAPV